MYKLIRMVVYIIWTKARSWYILCSENGKFGWSRAIRQSFTHSNLYHKTAGMNSTMNQYQANSREHAWLKLVNAKSTWTLFNHHYSPITTIYASSSWITKIYFTKKLCSVIGRHLYICVILSVIHSPHLILQTRSPF